MALVWYPGKAPRSPGLRLMPGWNAINEPTATELVERGVVLREKPEDTEEAPLTPEETEVLMPRPPKRSAWSVFRDEVRGIPTEVDEKEE